MPKFRRRFLTKRRIKRLVQSLVPKHIYYSALKFLDPSVIGPKDEWVPCLGGDLVFDIDIKKEHYGLSLNSVKKAAEEALKVIDMIKELGLDCSKIVFSGWKGFHIYVEDFDPYDFLKVDPLSTERYRVEEEARGKIVNFLLNQGAKIDAEVTNDIRRVIRLPNSLHGKTTMLCAEINKNILTKIREDPTLLKEIVVPKMFKENIKFKIIHPNTNKIIFFDEEYHLVEDIVAFPVYVMLLVELNSLCNKLNLCESLEGISNE